MRTALKWQRMQLLCWPSCASLFAGNNLQGVRIPRRADLTAANLDHTDFTGADLTGFLLLTEETNGFPFQQRVLVRRTAGYKFTMCPLNLRYCFVCAVLS